MPETPTPEIEREGDSNQRRSNINDGLDDLAIDIESPEETRRVLSSLASSGVQFEDGTLESLSLRRLTIQDREILYTQRYEPRCHFCSHPMRDEAEALWIESGRNTDLVRAFMEKHGGPRSWSSVNNHLEQHCEWNLGPAINFMARVRHREPDLSEIRKDDFGWSVDALNSLILDLGRFSMTDDPEQAIKISRAIGSLTDSKGKLEKLRSELYGAQAQAEARVQSIIGRVTAFLRKLLEELENDPEQKGKVVELINELRREGTI